MQRHHHDAPAARQTLERSVQPGDVNVALRKSIHYGQHKGCEDELAVSKLSKPQQRESNPTNSTPLFQTEMAITARSLPRKL